MNLNAEARQRAASSRQASADSHARMVYAEAEPLFARGLTLRALAEELNDRLIPTPTGKGEWQATTVQRLVRRIRRLERLGQLETEEWLQ